ncbi:MAG: hypothetical protein Kow0069_18090 [Promethearchaeota archaeon]
MRKRLGLPKVANVVYFQGCTSKYRRTRLRDATASVMRKLGVEFTVVDEWCCGSPLLRTGQVERVASLAEHNLESFASANARTVVTPCAGCYRTMTKDYAKRGFLGEDSPEVVHVVDFLLQKLQGLEPGLLGRKMGGAIASWS